MQQRKLERFGAIVTLGKQNFLESFQTNANGNHSFKFWDFRRCCEFLGFSSLACPKGQKMNFFTFLTSPILTNLLTLAASWIFEKPRICFFLRLALLNSTC